VSARHCPPLLLDTDSSYPDSRKDSYAEQYFTLRSTYLQGRQPASVNMHWRRFPVAEIPLEDHKEFDEWLRARWTEKDQLLDEYYKTGRFPSELAGSIDMDGVSTEQKAAASAGYVETHVKVWHWTELGQIFMVLASVGLFLCLLPKSLERWRAAA